MVTVGVPIVSLAVNEIVTVSPAVANAVFVPLSEAIETGESVGAVVSTTMSDAVEMLVVGTDDDDCELVPSLTDSVEIEATSRSVESSPDPVAPTV